MNIAETINQFFAWDIYLQIALPVGYLCHVIISHGIKDQSKLEKMIPNMGVFALISQMTWYIHFFYWKGSIPFAAYWPNIILCIVLPIVLAVLWRKYFKRWFFCVMHKMRIFNSTEHGTVWDEITENRNVGTAQITVYTNDGYAYSCDYIYDFEEAPIELYRVDEAGNVALYITHEKAPSDDAFEKIESPNLKEGTGFYRLTYIPEKTIQRVEFLTNHPC